MFQLDTIDRRILRALQADASLSAAALGEVVGASSASCWRRVKAMEAAGVLGPSVRLVDADAVGLGVDVICNVRLAGHSDANRAAFDRFVADHAEIMDCYSMSGEWDYLLRVVVADVAAYERFLMRDLLGQPMVATASSHFALARIKSATALPV